VGTAATWGIPVRTCRAPAAVDRVAARPRHRPVLV